MQRQIKFRAYYSGVMIGVSSLSTKTVLIRQKVNGKQNVRISDLELMQYTGLKDKNGVEIYKFDIFNIDGKNYYIDWSDDMCRFILTTGYGFDSRNCIDLTCDSVYGLGIIGNIYQNPELVNGDTKKV